MGATQVAALNERFLEHMRQTALEDGIITSDELERSPPVHVSGTGRRSGVKVRVSRRRTRGSLQSGRDDFELGECRGEVGVYRAMVFRAGSLSRSSSDSNFNHVMSRFASSPGR